MSKSVTPKKCIKKKLEEASELYEEIKKETEIVKVLLIKEVQEDAGKAPKRKASLSRN
jgi:hypothetical protein